MDSYGTRLMNLLGFYNLSRSKTYFPEFIQSKSNKYEIIVGQITTVLSQPNRASRKQSICQIGMKINNFQLLIQHGFYNMSWFDTAKGEREKH